MALVSDHEGVEVSPEPIRQLGIEPRSASDYIATTACAVPAASGDFRPASHRSD
jgi:hypothetical protein